MDILNFIRSAYPEVYECTYYNVVVISGRLATLKALLCQHN